MKKIVMSLSFLLMCNVNIACVAHTNASETFPKVHAVNSAFLIAAHLPALPSMVKAWQVTDKMGEHILFLDRAAGPSPSRPKSGRIEHIDISANYYSKMAGIWKAEWTIRDAAECPRMDAAAEFFTSAISFTDLNNDGIAEITVPYKLFCGGGVDTSTIKVILRQGAMKLAIRGQSLVKLPGQQAFGGEHQYDNDLLSSVRLPYKQHMDKIWAVVAEDSRN